MTDLNAWFEDRPMWMQKAACLLNEKGRLENADIANLFDMCVQEVSAGNQATSKFPFKSNFLEHNRLSLRLHAIGNIRNINALAPDNPLDFGTSNLSIIYGNNGSGKSGYVRILKHVCGARNAGILHPNVFENNSTEQSAEIEFSIKDQKSKKITWSFPNPKENKEMCPNSEMLNELCSVDIFDSDCGCMYLDKENEITYEPPELLFFSNLIKVCEKITDLINDKLKEYASKKPQMPTELLNTSASKWYKNIISTTSPEDVARNTKWTAENEESLNDLTQRLAEKSPADRAKELVEKKKHAEEMVTEIDYYLQKLSDENCHHILSLKKNKLLKQDAAKATTIIFSSEPLKGIGTDIWKRLWEHARRYSEEKAYSGHTFPHLKQGARCVLCQQPLSDDARKRLASFEEYVKGKAEEDAKIASDALNEALDSIKDIPTDQAIKTKCDAAGLVYGGEMPPVVTLLKVLEQRKAKLLEVELVDKLPDIPDFSAWLKEIKERVTEYSNSEIRYNKDAVSETRTELQNQQHELTARKWLSEQQEAIQEEIKRLISINLLEKAKKQANTSSLSKKKGELAEILITEAFIQRFCNELETLGASHIKVELRKKRVSRGHVLHELHLVNDHPCALRDILSEGEQRIIALAAFLADITGKEQSTPFVFDDPISSLDQNYEELVAQRLVRLAASRQQVIIFTHRISLMVLLQDYCKEEGIKPDICCVRKQYRGTGNPEQTPLYTQNPEKALNTLLNAELAKARKIFNNNDQADYERYAKSICSNFRILLERMIEYDLLCDVVHRFRRNIMTKGKLNKLAKISQDDCKMFDNLMTKYSRYEHSHSIEAPVGLPDPDELEKDMQQLKNWHSEFENR